MALYHRIAHVMCGEWLYDEINLAIHIRECHPGFWQMYGTKLIREAKKETNRIRKRGKKK